MIPQTLTNMNLFVDGRSLAGRVNELTLPKLRRKTEEHRAGGMDAPVKIALGMEALEASFKTSGIDRELLGFFGVADDTAFNAVFRGAFKDAKGKVAKAVCTLRGLIEEMDPGSWKPGDKNESGYTVAVHYYKLEIDDQLVYEIEPVSGVRIVNGKDELAEERAAIGL